MPKTEFKLTAADYMQRDIITVTPEDNLAAVLKLMTENHVTGLPVMDDRDHCVGLITATDILNYQEEHAEDAAQGATTQFFDPDTERWEDVPVTAFSLEDFADVRVADVMTRNLVWVPRNEPLKKVAQRMIEGRIHRVLVMDKSSRLYGIITAYDFVRMVAES